MTTVAYSDGVIACDGRVTMGALIIVDDFIKIIKTDKYLAGISGEIAYSTLFLRWVKSGCDPENVPLNILKQTGNIDAFTVSKDGTITAYDSTMIPTHLGKMKIYAVGSGSNLALGAMEAGADCVTAVKIAIRHDSASGGTIRRLSHDTNKRSSKTR